MGVMACDRNGCDNIMCDKYSDTHGYICDDCFEEMISVITTMAQEPSHANIKTFMESQKSNMPTRYEYIKKCLKQEFVDRYDYLFDITEDVLR